MKRRFGKCFPIHQGQKYCTMRTQVRNPDTLLVTVPGVLMISLISEGPKPNLPVAASVIGSGVTPRDRIRDGKSLEIRTISPCRRLALAFRPRVNC